MNTEMHVISRTPWQTYKEIENVIDKRFQLSKVGKAFEHKNVALALQILGQAVIIRHNLCPKAHRVTFRSKIEIETRSTKTLHLSTTEEMVRAKICIWEEAIQPQQAGHDVWTEERTAAYRPQNSLQKVLKMDYFEIKKIVCTMPWQAAELYNRIQAAVQAELKRLRPNESAQEKIAEITCALKVLSQAVAYKYKTTSKTKTALPKNKQDLVDSLDLYTLSTMLDAKIHKWSLRQTLNLSSYCPLVIIIGLQEALWGKATALQNVESQLEEDATASPKSLLVSKFNKKI